MDNILNVQGTGLPPPLMARGNVEPAKIIDVTVIDTSASLELSHSKSS